MNDPFNKLVMDFEDELAQKQAEIERLTFVKDAMFKDLEVCDAVIANLMKERNELRASMEKDHASFNEAAKFSTECIANLTNRVEELEKDNRRLDYLIKKGPPGAHEYGVGLTQESWEMATCMITDDMDSGKKDSDNHLMRQAIDAEMERE